VVMISRARLAVAAVALGVATFVGACGSGGGDNRDAASATTSTSPAANSTCPAGSGVTEEVTYASVPGVDPNLLSLDVYPATHGCPAPVVVWVHGGGWRAGDKANQMSDKVRLWRDAGYTVVSVNYRLTDPSVTPPVRYPTHNEDVAGALAWVHDHIADFGGDPDRLALLGHSAGAQIVASVATDERYLAAHGLALDALRCAGSLDTEGYDVAAMAGAGNAIYRGAFGDDPATWTDASPVTHVVPGKGIPRFLVIERGTPRRRRSAEAFAARLRDAGVGTTVVDGGSLSHAQVNSEIGRPGDAIVTPALSAFLAECFVPTP